MFAEGSRKKTKTKTKVTGSNSTIETLLPTETTVSLEHEYSLLRLLHHRNKNQHRVATWWKHLNTLKRDLTKLLAMNRCVSLTSRQSAVMLAYKIRHVDVTKCYRAFNGIVALGQFVTLGLTLLGMLARVNDCIGKMDGLEEYEMERKRQGMKTHKGEEDVLSMATVSDDLGEEIGEVVSTDIETLEKKRKSDLSLLEPEIKKKKKKLKSKTEAGVKPKSSDLTTTDKKKKKKKKTKSAIDDIFG
ncbi:Ribonuclease MRP protein subunit RMP1 [Cyberlindnera fabianii]|uniref:Ribonuclease MRP protein subunit RMP1 n=1 Tax=Cyberlindnera fabianii TaxID=36022 RepID=A0A1V2L8P0_CYBFA|nr:Ribonuclease MRP protein subunit RMP1 [Cyberlindnera fabianii]